LWLEFLDHKNGGRLFYYDNERKHSQWERPTEENALIFSGDHYNEMLRKMFFIQAQNASTSYNRMPQIGEVASQGGSISDASYGGAPVQGGGGSSSQQMIIP
jgi:hypothetical protein